MEVQERHEGAPKGATSRQHSALSRRRSRLDDPFAGTKPTTSPGNEVQSGFGDGLAKAFELVLTPAILGLAGFVVDRWLGVTPLLTVLFTVWALGAVCYMTWFRYDAEMRRVEEGAVWARSRRERR